MYVMTCIMHMFNKIINLLNMTDFFTNMCQQFQHQ